MQQRHFVFVHGYCGGGRGFYKIRCLLEKCGHKVSCPDLKSRGIDPTDPKTILTFEDYNQPLIDDLLSLPENQKVILVGHSAGGLSLTHAIHKFPERIHLAVFVAATMLRSGFCTDQDIRIGIPAKYRGEAGSASTRNVCDPSCSFNLSTTPKEILTLASMLEKERQLEAIRAARFTDEKDVDKVPRIYIKTMLDEVLVPEQQEAMIDKWPPLEVHALQCDHNPFFTAPLDLFALLLRAAE